jgi:hypothetical protein
MASIWAFGDSFTDLFENQFTTDIRWAMDYSDYCKGIPPKNFSQIVASQTGMKLYPKGQGGSSNYTIFYNFIRDVEEFKSGDIVVIGWTVTSRYLVANKANIFSEVLNPELHDIPHPDLSRSSLVELALNRSTYTVWYSELLSFMKIMRMARPDVKLIFWTWADPIEENYTNLFSERKNGLIMIGYDWHLGSEHTKKSIQDSVDYIFRTSELGVDDLSRLKELRDDNKAIIIIEDGSDINIAPKIFDIGGFPYNAGSVVNDFYKELMPFKKYTTIEQETKGVVKDLHYSEIGHKEFAEDLLIEIKKVHKTNKRNLI